MTATKETTTANQPSRYTHLFASAFSWTLALGILGGLYVTHQYNKGVRIETVKLYAGCVTDPSITLNCETVNPFIP